MNLQSIRIILVETTHPGNIGSSARAMKNMGLKNLYLVKPKQFPDEHATAMAVNAHDILTNCVVVNSLSVALQGCKLIFATSARSRSIDLPTSTPYDCAKLLASVESNTQIAIIFGRENTGLTNDELLQCNYHIHIPTNIEYNSLNLSQSVQIMCYEIRMRYLKTPPELIKIYQHTATADELSDFYIHLTELLFAINFFKTKNHIRIERRIRRLFNRMHLETLEVRILRGIISKIQYQLKRLQ